jgi:hypothetical protein
VYAGLLLTEGLGLLLRKRWAEYLTIITTAGLIPIELYEMSRRATAGACYPRECFQRKGPKTANSCELFTPRFAASRTCSRSNSVVAHAGEMARLHASGLMPIRLWISAIASWSAACSALRAVIQQGFQRCLSLNPQQSTTMRTLSLV